MNLQNAAVLVAVVALPLFATDLPPVRPKSGPVEIMKLNDVKPGMKATAWTVFQGTVPEPVPVEIVGRLRNAKRQTEKHGNQRGQAKTGAHWLLVRPLTLRV